MHKDRHSFETNQINEKEGDVVFSQYFFPEIFQMILVCYVTLKEGTGLCWFKIQYISK
jgi:hypothetical protein